MTAFVLVPGAFTGGWIWQETADRLQESGAEAYPVTLTGLGDHGRPAGPETGLKTHIDDVVRLIDRAEAPDVVLVGHCYGIHPLLGAAEQRPERVSRIVYLDTGIPQDGDAPLLLINDQAVRERLLGRSEPSGDDARHVGPPASPQDWQRWGSTAGIHPAALAELHRRAVPQPLRTLTEPLRLSGTAAGLPTTGVLCTANGSSIALLETRLRFAAQDPRLKVLTEPQARFLELATGHWPMLSAPGELAEVLLRAAAGEGHRLAVAEQQRSDRPQTFLLDVPEQPRERIRHVDLHLPDVHGPRPAVVFVHGGPVPRDARPTPRDSPTFVGYARCVASLGAVGVTLDHRLHDLGGYGGAAEDVAAAVELVRSDPRVDADRVALWFFSAGGLLAAEWLAAPPPWLRCVAATYPLLVPLPGWGLTGPRFRPAAAVRTAGTLPIVLTRAGLEIAEFAATVEEFLTAAADCAARVEVIDVPLGHHGFETLDHTEQSRRAVQHAMRSVLGHLQ